MLTEGSPLRTRNSSSSSRLSRSDWTRLGVSRQHISLVMDFLIPFISAAQKAATSSPLSFGRIAKPLRGGGGVNASVTSTSPNSSTSSSSANPLTRLQNEEAGLVYTFVIDQERFTDSIFNTPPLVPDVGPLFLLYTFKY